MKKYWNSLKRRMNMPLTWIGHYYLYAMGTVFGYSGAVAVLYHWVKWPHWAGWLLFAPLGIGFVLAVQGSSLHDYGLCPKCYETMPLNPGELAEGKYRKTLKREHWLMDLPGYFIPGFLAVIFGLAYASKFMPFAASQFLFLATAAIAHFMAYHRIIHTRYYPWCPYCGHGDLKVEHVPDPSGVSR